MSAADAAGSRADGQTSPARDAGSPDAPPASDDGPEYELQKSYSNIPQAIFELRRCYEQMYPPAAATPPDLSGEVAVTAPEPQRRPTADGDHRPTGSDSEPAGETGARTDQIIRDTVDWWESLPPTDCAQLEQLYPSHVQLVGWASWVTKAEASIKEDLRGREPTRSEQARLGAFAILKDTVVRTKLILVEDSTSQAGQPPAADGQAPDMAGGPAADNQRRRWIGVRSYGAENGTPVMWLPGSPTGGVAYKEALLRDAGFTLYVIDRPGYGVSTPCPERTRPDWPDNPEIPPLLAVASDLRTVAHAVVGDERYFIGGVSGGTPPAIATAIIDDHVKGVLLIGTLASRDMLANPDEGMVGSNLQHRKDGYENSLPRIAQEFHAGDMDWRPIWGDAVPVGEEIFADLKKLSSEEASLAWALLDGNGEPNAAGWVADAFANHFNWRIRVDGIHCPVSFVAAEQDQHTPPPHAMALAQAIPAGKRRLTLIDGADHFAMDFHSWVAALGADSSPLQVFPVETDNAPTVVVNHRPKTAALTEDAGQRRALTPRLGGFGQSFCHVSG